MQYHIWQLKPIFYEFEDIIMCVKTGTLGPWGEQHTSAPSQNAATYTKMINAFLDAVPDSRVLLAYSGGFLVWYNATYGTNYNFTTLDQMPIPTRGTPEARIGIYDDGYAGSVTQSEGKGRTLLTNSGVAPGIFDRYRVHTWLFNQNTMTQGEGGISDNTLGNMPGAILEAQQLRTTALNMRHGNYQRWNSFIYTEAAVATPVTFPRTSNQAPNQQTKTAFYDPVYEGRTGLEYMRDRLGYRLLLREAYTNKLVEQNGVLRFEIAKYVLE
jgi:hypothetical protein